MGTAEGVVLFNIFFLLHFVYLGWGVLLLAGGDQRTTGEGGQGLVSLLRLFCGF